MQMKDIFLSICLSAMLSNYAHAETLYRWVDKDSKVHYGDKPAEDAIKAESKKFSAPAASDEDGLPYTVRKARQDFPVTLYVATNCGDFCIQARALLNMRGVPFVEKELRSKAEIDDFKTNTGGAKVPSLTIGRNFIEGFDARQWNGELDFAGYPKTAPYGSRQAQPAAIQPDSLAPAVK